MDKNQVARLPLSVYMITFNNSATITRALESVAGWADEVVVVDSHSPDGSADIAAKYADHVLHFDTTSQPEKYQFAQEHCRNTWVMFIDADEWLTGSFKQEVETILDSTPACDGYIADRRNIYLGREIKYGGWYPDREIRLYRKDRGGWRGGIHAKVHVEGHIGRMKNYYMHTPYADTAHQIRTIDRYSQAFASDLYDAGRHFHLFNMVLRPVYRLFRDYIFKRGFLDGIPGFIILASTMYYVFMKHARLWELEKADGGKKGVQ
jgi:glycosyltransferase involved in cell wall biosynthesis